MFLSKDITHGKNAPVRYGRTSQDMGHKRICGRCARRYDDDTNLIGKPRDLIMEKCLKCRQAKRSEWELLMAGGR